MKLSRIGAALAATAVLALTACAGSDTGATPAPSTTTTAEGAFPAAVQTKFDEVRIDEAPERIVALGWGDAETALALGAQPVGASDWLGWGGDGVGPYAADLYDESPEIIGTLEPSYEAIAALEPDLILDTKSSGDPERYQRLSEIATTVGVPEGGDNYLTTTEQQMELISAALGAPERGDELLAAVDARFDEIAEAHPEWQGLTATAATRTSESWGAYVDGSERVEFLERLGFVQNPAIAELPASESGFSVDISAERLDLLEADVIVAFPIFIETSQITDDPQWQQLPAVEEGRTVVIDGDLASAYSIGTVLAQQFVLDGFVPLLENAVPAE